MSNDQQQPRKDEGDEPIILQFTDRATNLEGIADEIERTLPVDLAGLRHMTAQDLHRIRGYMEQLRIIADELRKAQK